MPNEENQASHKVCKECYFEECNGHARGCSRDIRTKEFKCPKCDNGGLRLLTWQERKKLEDKIKRQLPVCNIFGCDECRYWATQYDVEDFEELMR